jgi:hypothetical protein
MEGVLEPLNGGRVAVNIVIDYEEGSESSFLDGDATSETGLTDDRRGGFDGCAMAAETMFEYGSRVRLLANQSSSFRAKYGRHHIRLRDRVGGET